MKFWAGWAGWAPWAGWVGRSQESRREGWTEKRSAVGFCLGSGLFGSYNSD